MSRYLLKRLLLLPVTLFAIILVNFVILNFAPGDPVNTLERTQQGDATREAHSQEENQYLLFREHYGLTLPILFNTWPSIKAENLHFSLGELATRKKNHKSEEMSAHDYHKLRTLWGDRAKFVMPFILKEAQNPQNPQNIRRTAANLFIRGGTRQGYVGPYLNKKQKLENREIAQNNYMLTSLVVSKNDSLEIMEQKIAGLETWFEKQQTFTWTTLQKVRLFFLETRFFRYLSRVVTLDFGTLRNDSNRTVLSEVVKRIKYSLTLAIIPMIVTFALCIIFGMIMAVKHNQWADYSFNILFLILFAIPVFVVAPFLIEKVALNKTIPFTDIAIPYSGFHSSHDLYTSYTAFRRLGDISLHIFLPLVAIMYGTLAVQARLARTAFLEVLQQDYIRTAKAKGLPTKTILIKHVGRNGAITIVTSLAASLGIILGGSLIIETIFEIQGFGRFFYEAILNRDFNVVLFSAFAGSFLTLIGYIIADISYVFLDPRVSLTSS